MRCRYFICDKKLAALGWTEKTAWKDGLRRTVDWYLAHGFASYWESGDVENVRFLQITGLQLGSLSRSAPRSVPGSRRRHLLAIWR